LVITITTV